MSISFFYTETLKFAPMIKENHSLVAQKMQKHSLKYICMDIIIYNMIELKKSECILQFDCLNQT